MSFEPDEPDDERPECALCFLCGDEIGEGTDTVTITLVATHINGALVFAGDNSRSGFLAHLACWVSIAHGSTGVN